MRVCKMCLVAGLAALALFAGGALADVIILKNGNRIVGQIERIEPGPPCANCSGKGEISCPACLGKGRAGTLTCASCKGEGRLKCPNCKGRGSLDSYYVIRVKGGMRTVIPESQVESVERSEVLPEDLLPTRESYTERLKKLTGNPEEELELAKWALERGLLNEAVRHAKNVLNAQRLLEGLSNEAKAVLEAAERRLEAAAIRALNDVFASIRAGRFEEALRALEELRGRHAAARVISDDARFREFLGERAGDLVPEFGDSLSEMAQALGRKARLVCPSCLGTGLSICKKCSGTGEGLCARCKGSGQLWCPDCNGTQWRVCPSCGGTGKGSSLAAQFGVLIGCGECLGRGVVQCKRCKNGRISCPSCGGKGKLPGTCDVCGGKGSRSCDSCAGTGLRKPEKLAWGPVVECSAGAVVSKDAQVVPLWQGIRRGCIITAIRESDLHDGALSAHLAAASGERREILLVCVDNRDGKDQVEFEPDRQGLRLVTEGARQIEVESPTWLEKVAAARPDLRDALAQFAATAVLPGVVANAAGAFPRGTDFTKVLAVYWGREDPLKLSRRFITLEEFEAIRKTLR